MLLDFAGAALVAAFSSAPSSLPPSPSESDELDDGDELALEEEELRFFDMVPFSWWWWWWWSPSLPVFFLAEALSPRFRLFFFSLRFRFWCPASLSFSASSSSSSPLASRSPRRLLDLLFFLSRFSFLACSTKTMRWDQFVTKLRAHGRVCRIPPSSRFFKKGTLG